MAWKWWYNRIDPLLKAKIQQRVKNDWIPVIQTAEEYWVHPKTIHNWLNQELKEQWWWRHNLWEIRRLKKDKDELLLIIWELTAELNKSKKKR